MFRIGAVLAVLLLIGLVGVWFIQLRPTLSETAIDSYLDAMREGDNALSILSILAIERRHPEWMDARRTHFIRLHEEQGDSAFIEITEQFGIAIRDISIRATRLARDEDIVERNGMASLMGEYLAEKHPMLCADFAAGRLNASELVPQEGDQELRNINVRSAEIIARLIENSYDAPVEININWYKEDEELFWQQVSTILTAHELDIYLGTTTPVTEQDHRNLCVSTVKANDIIMDMPLERGANFVRVNMGFLEN